MKIHGTAKGAALSTKDFGVAFGGGAPGFIEATGGTITTIDTDYKVHTFTSSGTFEITSGLGNVEHLVIAGGGGGGAGGAAGAGAGGYVTATVERTVICQITHGGIP